MRISDWSSDVCSSDLIETPWETAIKKVFYRSSTFKLRDVFDLAAVVDHDGERLKSCLPEVEDKLDRLLDRIDALVPVSEERAKKDINPTERGRKYMAREAIESAVAFLREWRRESLPAR